MHTNDATKIDDTMHAHNDACAYNERIHEIMCELIARVDAHAQRDNAHVSHTSLIAIRNACEKYVNEIINAHE